MKSDILINRVDGRCQIDIEGTIGLPEEWQFEDPEARVATYERFRESLRQIAEIDADEVVVNIRSTGGDVNDALLIHDALRQLPARITTCCFGFTASAATIIAQAASEGCRCLSPNALYLIHNSICAAEGNAVELASKIELLRQTDARIAALYAARSGRPVEAFEALMSENSGNGRWMNPDEAIAAGLADRIVEPGADDRTALVRNLADGWNRLLGRFARKNASDNLPPQQPRPNILHFDANLPQPRVCDDIAAEEARRVALPTSTLPCEDPSFGDTIRSANERAYAEDARNFRKFE